jgi:hypothetical protein
LETPCIEWQGYKLKRGYGRRWYKGKPRLAHRVAYSVAHNIPIDDVPPLLRHTCDNPSCINPEHLIPGSYQDNMDDRAKRGRTAVGSRASGAKLTETDVLQIRKDYPGVDKHALAERYGVHWRTVGDIINYRYWKHI